MSNPALGYELWTAFDIVAVTPDDSNNLATPARALRVKPISGTDGTIRVTTPDGEIRNTEIVAGETLLVQAIKVHATGTTATGIEAFI